MWMQKFSHKHWALWPVQAWHRVLMSDLGSSSSHPIDPKQNWLLQAFDEVLRIKSEAMWQDGWSQNVTIASDHPKHRDVNSVLFSSIGIWICLQTETNILKSSNWRFLHDWQAVQHTVSKCPKQWIAPEFSFPLEDCSTVSGLLHSRQSLKEIKHELIV